MISAHEGVIYTAGEAHTYLHLHFIRRRVKQLLFQQSVTSCCARRQQQQENARLRCLEAARVASSASISGRGRRAISAVIDLMCIANRQSPAWSLG